MELWSCGPGCVFNNQFALNMWTNLTAVHYGAQLCMLTRPPPSLFMVLTLISRLTVGLILLSAGVLEDHPSDPAGWCCCDSNWKHGRNLSAAPTDTASAVVIEDLASSSTSTITAFFFHKDVSENTQDQSHLAFCLPCLVFCLTSLLIIINIKIKVNHWGFLSCQYCFVCLLEHQGPSEQQGFKDPVGPRWPFGYHWLWHGEKDPRTFVWLWEKLLDVTWKIPNHQVKVWKGRRNSDMRFL